jgi:DNA-binding NarL/FixJ family response regulator
METKESARPRVVVADDSESMVRIVSRIACLHFEVVGVARDGQAAIDAVQRLRPDVLVLDIFMPVYDGIQVVRRLKAQKSDSTIVILTGLEKQEYMDAAMAAGASGFVFKSRMANDLLRAIGDAVAGRKFMSAQPTRDLGEAP